MQPIVLPLWPDGVPGAEGAPQAPSEATENEAPGPHGLRYLFNVTLPTLTVTLPDPAQGDAPATGVAVVVCPGGAFHFLAIDYEGHDVAAWLNAHGIAAGVLKYRVVPTGEDYESEVEANLNDPARRENLMRTVGPMIRADGQQALRLMRRHAVEWGIDPQRVGIMGFSAGGAVTLAAGLAEREAGDDQTRPDFLGVIYGGGLRDADTVPADAPPLFTCCASDDSYGAHGTTQLYQAWQEAGVSAEMHVYAKGGHGFGMRTLGLPSDTWIERFAEWLEEMGIT